MAGDWLFDAVQVEVAYRTEQLRKAGRSRWVDRADRLGRRIKARKVENVVVPVQARREAEPAATPERTR